MISRFYLSALVLLGAFSWALGLYFSKVPISFKSFFIPLSIVTTVLSSFLYVFDKWLWKWKGINYLANRPNLGGNWKGTLQSDWKENDETIPPKDAYMVVHQTFSEVHFRQLTDESGSVTLVASIMQEEGERFSAVVVYRNESDREYREKSPIHRGSMVLQVAGENQERLIGEYWTERKTKGTLKLERISRIEAHDLEQAQKLVIKLKTNTSDEVIKEK